MIFWSEPLVLQQWWTEERVSKSKQHFAFFQSSHSMSPLSVNTIADYFNLPEIKTFFFLFFCRDHLFWFLPHLNMCNEAMKLISCLKKKNYSILSHTCGSNPWHDVIVSLFNKCFRTKVKTNTTKTDLSACGRICGDTCLKLFSLLICRQKHSQSKAPTLCQSCLDVSDAEGKITPLLFTDLNPKACLSSRVDWFSRIYPSLSCL